MPDVSVQEGLEKKKRGKRGGKKVQERKKIAQDDPKEVAPVHPKDPLDSSAPVEASHEKVQEAVVKNNKRGRRGGKNKVKPQEEKESSAVDTEHHKESDMAVDAPEKSEKSMKKNKKDSSSKSPVKFAPLPADVRDYFMLLESKLDEPTFEEEEERDIFITNMYKELEEKEVMMAADFDGSRILEKIFPLSTDFQLVVFASRLIENLTGLFRHQFASHVIQSLLYLAADIVDREQTGKSQVQVQDDIQEPLPTMSDIIQQYCETLKEEWHTLIADNYASHLVRVLLSLLSGNSLTKNEQLRSKKSKQFKNRNSAAAIVDVTSTSNQPRHVPDSFKTLLTDLSHSLTHLLSPKEMRELAVHPVANPVLQLLVTLNGCHQPFVEAIMEESKDASATSFLVIMMKDRVGSHLMEVLIENADDALYTQLFAHHFKGKMVQLCLEPVANFVVQKLIVCAKTAHQAECVMEELKHDLGKLLFNQRGGVVEKLFKMAGIYKTQTAPLLQALYHALEWDSDNKEHVPLLIDCITTNRQTQYIKNLHYGRATALHGCLIAQHLLEYFSESQIQPLIQSILSMPTDTLLTYLTHSSLSRVLECFYTSPTVPLESKWALAHSLLTHYPTLAKDKYGCHFIDKVWAVADVTLKENIAKELLQARSSLEASRYGLIMLRNCKVDSFAKGKGHWKERETGIEKKRKMFEDLLPDPNKKKESSKKARRVEASEAKTETPVDSSLASVLDAIRHTTKK